LASTSTDGRRVSVIVPSYKRVDSVSVTVESVLVQTEKEIQTIIVNDWPEDRKRLESKVGAMDPRIKLIHNKSNLGAPASRNRGIEESSGDYVALLDDDDIWEPTKLEKQLRIMESNPKVGFVGCGYHDEWLGMDRFPELRGRIDEQLLMSFSNIETSTILIRRSVLEKVGPIDTSLPSEQNHDFFYEISKVCEFDYIPEVLVTKKAPEVQISKNPRNKIVGYVRFHRKHMGDIRALGKRRCAMMMGKFLTTLGLFVLLIGNEKRIDQLYEGVFRKIRS
jgi:glycosyltransferase involved in cell wall biosynthesis